LKNKIKERMRSFQAQGQNIDYNRTKFKITIHTGDDRTFLNISTRYLPFNEAINDINRKIDNAMNEYDNVLNVKKITVEKIFVGNPHGDQIVFGRKKLAKITDIINIKDLIGDMVVSQKSNRKLIQLLKNNKVCNPSSYKNCLIKSCYMSKMKRENVLASVNLFIDNHRDKLTVYTPNVICPLLSTVMKRTIKVHFVDYEVETITYGTYTKTIEILIHQGHSYGLIPRQEGDVIIPKVEEQKLIERPKKNKNKEDLSGHILATFDIETCNLEEKQQKKNQTECYAIGFYTKKHGYKEFYKKTKEANIVSKFIRYIFKSIPEEKIIMYSHNGGKFDIYLILETMLNESECIMTSFLEQGGRIINLTMKGKKKQLILRDSICLIAGSLDSACKNFKPKTKKLTGDVNHNLININNCYTKEIYDYTHKYLENDCISLYEILEIFDKLIEEAYGFKICDVLTNASIARKVFLKSYDSKDTPIHELPIRIDRELRENYFGGRNEVFTKLGTTKKPLYYVDFTSLYPYIMWKYNIQYGKVREITVEEKDKSTFNKEWYGFIKCKFRHKKKNNIPLHPIIKDNRLVFPYVDTWQEAVIYSEEIRYSIENDIGYEYEFNHIYQYDKKSRMFYGIVEDLYKMKIEAQKKGNKALRSIAKIIINSLYGFWGINHTNRDQTIISRENDSKLKEGVNKASHKTEAKLFGYIQAQQLKDYRRAGKYDIYNITAPIKASCANVGIASYHSTN
jgi:hypothetical protein